MMFRSRNAQITIFAAGSAFALITAIAGDGAQGEGNLDASYTISFARIPVGEITAAAVFGQTNTQFLRARVLVARLKQSWWTAKLRSPDRAPSKTVIRCRSKIVWNTETSDVRMVLDEGNVKELAATPPPSSDRVPVTNSNRQRIVDPLTALLFSGAAADEGLT